MKKSIPEGLWAQDGVMKIGPRFSSVEKIVKFEKINPRSLFWPPSWGPSWSQVAIKIHFEVGQNFDLVSEGILEQLGLDFGGVWGVKMESQNELKIRSMKTRKFDSRRGASSLFEVSG